MRVRGFRRFGYYLSIATLVGLVWLSQGPANLHAGSESALAASDPVIAAAGDIACDPSNSNFNGGNGSSNSCRQKYTSDLLVNANLAAVLLLGDNQYYCGGYQAWLQSYDLSWGRVKSITRPSVGNHEYLTSGGTDCTNANAGAAGYFKYFGSAAGSPSQGYYSFNIGAWHLVALNSNCGNAGGCGSSSPQGQWLQQDLAAHSNLCTLAFWHIPLFSSGGRASSNTQSIWQTLYNNDVDVVLNGHDHIYERFAPQAPNATLDTARGIRQFTVGTGGANHTSLATIAANSELRNTDTFGILKMTLHPGSYDWQFVHESGKTFSDSGTGLCHGSNQTIPTNTPMPTPTRTSTSIGTSTPTPTPTPTGRASTPPGIGATNTFTFSPAADSYVSETSPTTNYGASNMLRTDGSPLVRSYMRFDVQNVVGRVTRATLRIYANSSLSVGYDVRSVSNNTWGEMTINYNNAPTFGSIVGTSGPITSGQWTSVDITSLIAGNGTYNMAITSSSSTALSLASRNAVAANQPQLIIEAQVDPTPTPSLTSTPTNTATSTATQTQTSTFTSTGTFTSTQTATPSPVPTNTSTATATPSPTGTMSPTPTPTSVQIATNTPTLTAAPTATSSNPGTSTPTATSTDTETSTPTSLDPATDTPTYTATSTPGDPSTDTPTPTDPGTATPTPAAPASETPTPMDTESSTPTSSDPASASPTPTETGTATATNAAAPTSTPTVAPSPTPAARTFTVNAAADAYVNESSPTTNYGTATQIRVDGSPLVRSFLRFDVQNMTGRITRVTLRVYANSASSVGYDARGVTSSWSESSITYNNAPPFGSAISSSGSFNSGVWTSVDLTSLVTGNGTYNIALTTAGSTAVSLASRESGVNAPQLIIETAP